MFNHLAEFLELPDGDDRAGGRRGAEPQRRAGDADAPSDGVSAGESACRSGAIEVGGIVHREAAAAACTGRTRCTSATGCSPGRTACTWSCGPRFTFARMSTMWPSRCKDEYHDPDSRAALRDQRRRAVPAAAADAARGPRQSSPTMREGSREISYQLEAERGYRSRGYALDARLFRGESAAAIRPATLVASTEPWATVLALSPDEALDLGRRSGARRLIELAHCRRRDAHRRRTRAGGGPIHHYARRAAWKMRRGRAPPATKCAPSSPAITGSPTGAATP